MDEDHRMDDEEEEDVVGLLFATSDEDFVPPSGVGNSKGNSKGKSRAIAMDGVIDSLKRVGASLSTIIQRKRRKPFPDETKPEYWTKHDDDIDDESDEADPLARAISAPTPVLLDARPKKRRRTTTMISSSSSSILTFCHHCRYP